MKCKCLLLRVLVLEFEKSFSFVCSSSNLVLEVAIELLLIFFPAKSTHSKTLFRNILDKEVEQCGVTFSMHFNQGCIIPVNRTSSDLNLV